MTNVSDAGRPAVEAIAFELYDRFGEDVKQDRVKQFIGFLTRQVMERNGYRHVRYGRKVKENPVFSTASQYALRDD
jgi:hypothetical protein